MRCHTAPVQPTVTDSPDIREARPHPAAARRQRALVPRVLAWLLVLGWCVAAAIVVLLGERQSDLYSLQDAIVSGAVDEVRMEGGLDASMRGSGLVELHWSQHGIGYVAEVTQLRGRQFDGASDDRPDVRGDVAVFLQQSGDVRVASARRHESGFSTRVLGWELTGPVGWLIPGLAVLTLAVLVGGHEPRRATRWAWAWLMLASAPLGGLAFLLFGGPCEKVIRRPTPSRLTGGWAFLLMLLLGGFSS